MTHPICPNCGLPLSIEDRTSEWYAHDEDGAFLHAEYTCPCGCYSTIEWDGPAYTDDEGDPIVREYGVSKEKARLYDSRPFGERTYDLLYNGEIIHNVPYDSVRLIEDVGQQRINQPKYAGKMLIVRQSNAKPRNRLFRRMG